MALMSSMNRPFSWEKGPSALAAWIYPSCFRHREHSQSRGDLIKAFFRNRGVESFAIRSHLFWNGYVSSGFSLLYHQEQFRSETFLPSFEGIQVAPVETNDYLDPYSMCCYRL